MSAAFDPLKERLRRWVLIVGVAQVLFGCLVGFIPPSAVPWFRGIVMAHIEFTANGVLMVAVGLLTRELHLGAPALWLWFWTLVVGTWTNGAAGVLGAFVGQSSRLMPTLNQTFLLLSLVGLIRGVPLTAAGPLKPAVGGYQAAPSSS